MDAAIYDEYAPVYAATGQAWVGLHALAAVRRWLEAQGLAPRSAVDLGCGSGEVALALAGLGLRVTGIDRSAAMLGRARAPEILRGGAPVTWVEADLGQWALAEPVDLALSLYDTFNYLASADLLRAAIGRAAAALRPGGVLAFDVNTPLEYATWPERATVTSDTDAYFVYNMLDYDAETRLASGRIVWFANTGGGWRRGAEQHTQRAHSDAEICAGLELAGLELAERLTLDGAAADLATATRILYLARK